MTLQIPDEVVRELAIRYDVDPMGAGLLGGGAPSSDGVRYVLPGDPARVLKIQPQPAAGLATRLAVAERLGNVALLTRRGASKHYDSSNMRWHPSARSSDPLRASHQGTPAERATVPRGIGDDGALVVRGGSSASGRRGCVRRRCWAGVARTRP
jgi:hypothetical protein